MEKNTNEELLEVLLKAAEYERKGDWSIYNTYKRKIEEIAIDYDTYERAIHDLLIILKL